MTPHHGPCSRLQRVKSPSGALVRLSASAILDLLGDLLGDLLECSKTGKLESPWIVRLLTFTQSIEVLEFANAVCRSPGFACSRLDQFPAVALVFLDALYLRAILHICRLLNPYHASKGYHPSFARRYDEASTVLHGVFNIVARLAILGIHCCGHPSSMPVRASCAEPMSPTRSGGGDPAACI